MNRDEVLSMGVPEERLREFQNKYNQDLKKAVRNQQDGSAKAIRAVIDSMLPLIRSTPALREILELVTRLYCSPRSKPKEEE